MIEWLYHLDITIFTKINSVWTSAWMDSFFPFITDLHKTTAFKLILIPLVLGLFIFFRGLKKGLVIFLFSILSFSLADGVGNYAFKKTFQRSRPFENSQIHTTQRSPAAGYSFISNHATNNFAFATFVSVFFPPTRILLFTVATVVSYSRVYNGVHYPSDVLIGALVGTLSGLLMSMLCNKALKKMNVKSEASV